jgi:hypothetical protein
VRQIALLKLRQDLRANLGIFILMTNKIKKSVHLVLQGSTAATLDLRIAVLVHGTPIPLNQVQLVAFHAHLTLKQLHGVQPRVSQAVITVVVQTVTRAILDFTWLPMEIAQFVIWDLILIHMTLVLVRNALQGNLILMLGQQVVWQKFRLDLHANRGNIMKVKMQTIKRSVYLVLPGVITAIKEHRIAMIVILIPILLHPVQQRAIHARLTL